MRVSAEFFTSLQGTASTSADAADRSANVASESVAVTRRQERAALEPRCAQDHGDGYTSRTVGVGSAGYLPGE